MSKKLFFHTSRQNKLFLENDDCIIFDSPPIKQHETDMIVNTSKIYIWKPGQYMINFNVYDNNSQPISTILYLNNNIIIESLLQNIVIITITELDISQPYYSLTEDDVTNHNINATAVIQLKTCDKNSCISNASITILEV